MFVIIRFKSQRALELSFTSKSTISHYSSISIINIVENFFDIKTLRNFAQYFNSSTKIDEVKRARFSSQKSQKQSRKHSISNETKQSQNVTKLASSNLVNYVIMHWSCRFYSCSKEVFIYSINVCTRCGHEMNDHEKYHHLWNLDCDFVCERQDLVAFILQLVQNTKVMIIRVTFLVEKSILFRLLDKHILDTQRDLKSIFIHWESKSKRDNLRCDLYLQREEFAWREINAKYRSSQSTTRTIYLIDETQDSYEEKTLWDNLLKSRNIKSQSLFVLVCLYDVANISHVDEFHVESQALCVDSFQRIELRQFTLDRSCMLFKSKKTIIIVEKWAIVNRYMFDDDLLKYLHVVIDDHSSIVLRV